VHPVCAADHLLRTRPLSGHPCSAIIFSSPSLRSCRAGRPSSSSLFRPRWAACSLGCPAGFLLRVVCRGEARGTTDPKVAQVGIQGSRGNFCLYLSSAAPPHPYPCPLASPYLLFERVRDSFRDSDEMTEVYAGKQDTDSATPSATLPPAFRDPGSRNPPPARPAVGQPFWTPLGSPARSSPFRDWTSRKGRGRVAESSRKAVTTPSVCLPMACYRLTLAR